MDFQSYLGSYLTPIQPNIHCPMSIFQSYLGSYLTHIDPASNENYVAYFQSYLGSYLTLKKLHPMDQPLDSFNPI